tara:strand:- start:584 stop:772 length:189 start_codon:yes stop_codon:yes gene_type:complete
VAVVAQQFLLALLDVRVVRVEVEDTLKLVAQQRLDKEILAVLVAQQPLHLLMAVLEVAVQVL